MQHLAEYCKHFAHTCTSCAGVNCDVSSSQNIILRWKGYSLVAGSRAMSGYWHSWRESEVEAADEGVTVPGIMVRRCDEKLES